MAKSKDSRLSEQMEQSIVSSTQTFDMMVDETLFQESVRDGGNLYKIDRTTG